MLLPEGSGKGIGNINYSLGICAWNDFKRPPCIYVTEGKYRYFGLNCEVYGKFGVG